MRGRNNLLICFLLLLLWVPALAQHDSDAAEAKPASFSGVVRNSVTSEPLAHVCVRLQFLGKNAGITGAVNVITNAEGQFAFTNIVPGTHILIAERRGFGPGSASGRRITFKSGEEIKDVVLSLVPDAVIAGRVIDAEGNPVERTTVEVLGGRLQPTVETDDRGEFRIGGLHTGKYLVKASSGTSLPREIRTDGTAEINYGPTYYPSARTARSARAVNVSAGQEVTGIEIKLISVPVLHISGTILNVPKDEPARIQLDDGLSQRTYTADANGKFTIWRVPPGRYQIVAENGEDSAQTFRSAPMDIRVANSSIENINLVPVMFPLKLTGQVKFQGDTKISGEDGKTMITLEPVGAVEQAAQSDTIDEDGELEITDLWPIRYRVRVENSTRDYCVKSVRLGNRELENGIVDLRSGATREMLVVELASDGAQISGKVRDSKGPPSLGEVVLFFDDDEGLIQAGKTETQPDGSYVFHGIAPGKYKVLAYDPISAGDAWSPEILSLYSSVIERIQVTAGDKVSQDLKILTVPSSN